MDKKLYHKLLDYMIQGKSFRMKSSVRDNLKRDFYFMDTWFTIIAINASGTVDMCGNLHSIFNNYDIDNFVFD